MKIEVEIPVAEIQAAVQKQVAEAVRVQVNHWGSCEYIKAQISAQWCGAIDAAVSEALADIPAIKAVIRDELTKKLKAQITKLMKEEK